MHMAAHLAKWFLALGAILGKSALFKPAFPSAKAFEFNCHIARGTTLVVFCMDFGAHLEQSKDADPVPAYHSPMQRRKTSIVTRVRICAVFEQYFDGERVTLIGGPHEGGVSGGIAFINGNRLVKEV